MAKKRVNDEIKKYILEYLKEKNHRGVTKWEISNMLLTNNISKFRANPKNVIYILQELKHEGKIVSYRVGRDYYFKLLIHINEV